MAIIIIDPLECNRLPDLDLDSVLQKQLVLGKDQV